MYAQLPSTLRSPVTPPPPRDESGCAYTRGGRRGWVPVLPGDVGTARVAWSSQCSVHGRARALASRWVERLLRGDASISLRTSSDMPSHSCRVTRCDRATGSSSVPHGCGGADPSPALGHGSASSTYTHMYVPFWQCRDEAEKRGKEFDHPRPVGPDRMKQTPCAALRPVRSGLHFLRRCVHTEWSIAGESSLHVQPHLALKAMAELSEWHGWLGEQRPAEGGRPCKAPFAHSEGYVATYVLYLRRIPRVPGGIRPSAGR